MEKHVPEQDYEQLITRHRSELNALVKKRKLLGWARFIVFIVTVFLTYKLVTTAGVAGLLSLVPGIGLLLFLVSLDVNNNRDIFNTKTLIAINEGELRWISHDFSDRFDGSAFAPPAHDYANDLDLFGPASVYQWLNRCYTEQGRKRLAENFLSALTTDDVLQRHEAITELAPLVEWRQQLEAFARHTHVTIQTQERAEVWLKATDAHFIHPAWKWVVPIYSFITLASAAASIAGYIPGSIFLFLYGVYLTTSTILSRNTIMPYVHLSGIVREIGIVQQLIQWIEEKNFHASLLKKMQEETGNGRDKAGAQIKKLKAILDRFDLRLNLVGALFLNPFLLWDVRQMIGLNEWRKKNRQYLPKWFALIAETEVLCSLATLRFNEPEWILPQFNPGYFYIQGQSIGHPLIKKDHRVTSDFQLEGKGKIALITGSNMAGKSTFLRSLGVNVVLAQMGAPVCAGLFTVSPVRLMSSMRIADNLAENTSTFYAELKKLKSIIEAVNRHEPVFILLDEILRGTNSFDRHTGSEALIAQLIRQKAIAVIATHDLDLAKLESQFPASVANYHFDVQVDGEELYFDYHLKKGVCTSMNASILMKKIGIELH
jgi:hypothetical protein